MATVAVGPPGLQIKAIAGGTDVDFVPDWYDHVVSIIAADAEILARAKAHADALVLIEDPDDPGFFIVVGP